MNRLFLFLLMLCLLLTSGAVYGQIREEPEQAPGEIIIGFKPELTDAEINALVTQLGGQIIGKLNLPKAKVRKVKLGAATKEATAQAIERVRTEPAFRNAVKYAEPNIIKKAFGIRNPGDAGILSQSNDPMLVYQWGYYDIAANWIPPQAVAQPIIAVIDTGVDYTHPELIGKVIKGYDFVNGDPDPMDDHGHGTHVAGIAAAKSNNGLGIAGVAWNAKILAVKVLNSQGWGTLFDILLGIKYAADNTGVKIINMSLGGGYSPLEELAVDYAVNTKGKLLVAAAGNNNSSTFVYPAAFSINFPNKVIAVAAHDWNRCRASFSNYGTWVSITAPGVEIISPTPIGGVTYNGDGFAILDGTSMASPFVAGAAAVAWALNPGYTNSQIGQLLTTNTSGPLLRDGTCWPNDVSTFGALNLLYIVKPSEYEGCDIAGVIGFALNAENGEPLTGARVQLTLGTTIKGTDYVPYYGYLNDPYDLDITFGGYGLFNILTDAINQNLKLTISQTKFARPRFDITTPSCDWVYAGNIPVPPNKPYYWLALTWGYGYYEGLYDAYLRLPNGSN
ncbi:MAG: S8 family serine peptidase, partial [Thermodesulfovibrionales bacterium]|nr:S8 family serine peptidase [Thermodesulfovibrionales bacterium]